MAKLVIEHISEKQGINFNTLVDKDFSQLSWLNAREPIYNELGEKVSKSYYYQNKKEAIRITYHKIFKKHEGIENVFVGVQKKIHWIDWAGAIGKTKYMQAYYFNLMPIDPADLSKGFTSKKMQEILKNELTN